MIKSDLYIKYVQRSSVKTAASARVCLCRGRRSTRPCPRCAAAGGLFASDDGGVFRLRKAAGGLSGLSALNVGGENRTEKPVKSSPHATSQNIIGETAANDGRERNLKGNKLPWQQCTSAGFLLAC